MDWVQVTFVSANSPQEVISILGLNFEDFTDCQTGIFGYRSQLRKGHISVLYDGRPGMGIHVLITGQGCREYENSEVRSWKEFFTECFRHGGQFTRLDIAIDDITRKGEKLHFTVPQLVRKIKRGECRSRFNRAKSIESIHIATGGEQGTTLYLGRDVSDIQIRFYEKNWERENAGVAVDEEITGWNRVEVQARRDRANDLAAHVVMTDDIGRMISGVIRNYVQFVERTSDQNRARWPECGWWVEFLQGVEKLRLSRKAPDITVERAMKWVEKQVSPTLAMIFAATDGDIEFILRMIAAGAERMTDLQEWAANQYIEEQQKIREEKEYMRRVAWNRYMFRTGAHREPNEKPFADNGDDEGLDPE